MTKTSIQRRLWRNCIQRGLVVPIFIHSRSLLFEGNASLKCVYSDLTPLSTIFLSYHGEARWLSGRVSDSGARGRGFETYRRRVVSLSKALYSPKVLVNCPGSVGSVPTWLKIVDWDVKPQHKQTYHITTVSSCYRELDAGLVVLIFIHIIRDFPVLLFAFLLC